MFLFFFTSSLELPWLMLNFDLNLQCIILTANKEVMFLPYFLFVAFGPMLLLRRWCDWPVVGFFISFFMVLEVMVIASFCIESMLLLWWCQTFHRNLQTSIAWYSVVRRSIVQSVSGLLWLDIILFDRRLAVERPIRARWKMFWPMEWRNTIEFNALALLLSCKVLYAYLKEDPPVFLEW